VFRLTARITTFVSERSPSTFQMSASFIPNGPRVDNQAIRGAGQGKSKQIRQWLKIHPFSFQWGLPSKFDSNPLIWMLTSTFTNRGPGRGLIPYVPGAKHS